MKVQRNRVRGEEPDKLAVGEDENCTDPHGLEEEVDAPGELREVVSAALPLNSRECGVFVVVLARSRGNEVPSDTGESEENRAEQEAECGGSVITPSSHDQACETYL